MQLQLTKTSKALSKKKNTTQHPKSGAHPAYFKGGGVLKNSISHSGADPKKFGGGEMKSELG